MKLTNLFLVLFALSLLFVTVAHAESGSSGDESDDDNDTSGVVALSERQAIELAQLQAGDGLEVVETDMEDNGWEIEFRSATREVEVFVSFSGQVIIVKDQAESYDDHNDESDDDTYDTDNVISNNAVRNVIPTVSIIKAIEKAQSAVKGRIIEVELKNRGDQLYWELETQLNEKIEISAGDGSVKEIRSETVVKSNGAVRAKVDTDSIEVRAKQEASVAEKQKESTANQDALTSAKEDSSSERSFWARIASIFS